MEQRLRKAIQAIKGIKIPDLPKAIIELDDELSKRFPSNQVITKIIESNTKLSGEVLRIANSPAMKLRSPVNSIRESVDALGYQNLKNLVVAAALKNLFDNPKIQEIIEHSAEVAFCCAEISEDVANVTRDEAYLMGLFHNGGSLLLAMKDPDGYTKIFSDINTRPVSGVEEETQHYSTTHMDVGLLLAQKWKLPVDILNAILLHHTKNLSHPNDRLRAMVSMLKIANVIVSEVSFGSYMSDEAHQYLEEAREDLMLSTDTINEIRKSLIAYA
ncbi:HDOD domain-containing protein [Hydrogenovibrio kuenenii]|uniref:HDOD domain-containing protein n=1 Tax=Hydrogenovibrio kuenenii TaxID=63658 RepID=UPI00046588B8|nr:HDOD domain-containing protein [Hydrogenovibrio kuenenii]